MRPVLIFALFMMLLFLPGLSSAETTEECQARCDAELIARDATCPQLTENADHAAEQCLQESQEKHNNCINSCPQSAPVETSKEK
jgi:hypothetical protein